MRSLRREPGPPDIRPGSVVKVLVSIGCVVLAGCGGDDTAKFPATITVTPATTAATPPPPSSSSAKTGQSGGIAVRVTKVRTSRSVSFLGDAESEITPDGKPRTRRAAAGRQFVYVATRVTNNARVALTLTCGLSVRTVLVNDRNRTFEPLQGLSQLRGNPACDDKVQPGSRSAMTWVFETPSGTVVNALAISDLTDPKNPAPFTQIPL